MIKYRILGILVIASVIVIVLPFFQKNKLDSANIAIAKTPVFPDQTIQVSTVDAPPMPVIAEIDDVNTVPTEKTTSTAPTASTTTHTDLVATPIATTTAHTTVDAPAPLTPTVATSFDKNGLVKLTEPTWVIQVGRFNDYTQASQLARRLSENGYHVLMQHYRTSRLTNLFVQPNNQAAAAYAIAKNLENHMHLHNLIVMHYKPF